MRKYPSYDEIVSKYNELHSWEEVASYYGIARCIIQRIRKINEN
jgi:hypothetical protein